MRSARRSSLALLPLVVALLVLPGPAAASAGTVPPEVRAYVTGGGLVADLADLSGAQHDIAFDDSTEPGPISRVFRWTEERLAGDVEGRPARMANEWAVPVSVAGDPVGVAIVSIDLETELPRVAEFGADADAAVALAAVPDDAQLVRDVGSGAWFALVDDTATSLAVGTSGVTAPTPVDELRLSPPSPEPTEPAATAGLGVAFAPSAVLLAVVVTLLFVGRSERRAVGARGPAVIP